MLATVKMPHVRGYDCSNYVSSNKTPDRKRAFVEVRLDLANSPYVTGGWPVGPEMGISCIEDMCVLSSDQFCQKADEVGVQLVLCKVDGVAFVRMYVAPGVEASAGATYTGSLPVRFYGTI